MPLERQRIEYGVVAGVMLVLAALGTVGYLARRALPPAEDAIAWREPSREVFSEALRQDRHVLLFAREPWSPAGRYYERLAFRDSEVASYVATHYVPIRIDAEFAPEWLDVPLPLSNRSFGLDGGSGVWVLSPEGALASVLPPSRSGPAEDPYVVLRFLIQSLEGQFPEIATEHRAAKRTLELVRAPAIDSRAYAQSLEQAWEASSGGFLSGERRVPAPWAWRVLIEEGNLSLATERLSTWVEGPWVDWIGGGFFLDGGDAEGQYVALDTHAVLVADASAAFAQAYVATGERKWADLARFGARAVLDRFVGRTLQPFVVVVATDDGRHPAYSLSPSLIRSRSGDAQTLSEFFELAQAGRQALVRMPPERCFEDRERCEALLGQARGLLEPAPDAAGTPTASDTGAVVARLIETARLLDDARLTAEVSSLYVDLARAFRVGLDDVRRSAQLDASMAGLGDYGAIAEAAYQHWRLTGDPSSLDDGVALVRRGVERFYDEKTGGLRTLSGWAPIAGMPDLSSPDVTDGVAGSAAAKFLRAWIALAQVEPDLDPMLARATVARMADVAALAGYDGAGVVHAYALARRGG